MPFVLPGIFFRYIPYTCTDCIFIKWSFFSAVVFTIHILLYGHTFPMAYCFCLTNRDRYTTALVFMLLKDAALAKVPGISFDVAVVVSDFELAMCRLLQ